MRPHETDHSWLYGYAVGGVGGISPSDAVRVGLLSRINFLVGRNNHGKSTLLRAAMHWTEARSRNEFSGPRETLVPVSSAEVERFLRTKVAEHSARLALLDQLEDLGNGLLGVWVARSSESNSTAVADSRAVTNSLRQQFGLEQYSGGHQVNPAFKHVAGRAVLIPAFRQMRPVIEGGTADLASGEGLVAELGHWERPRQPNTAAYMLAKRRWLRLRDFVREVLEDSSADIEVADYADLHVRLSQSNSMLHIDQLGDGIKQVLMIAAACINYEDHLILLEEPEIHLHAGLQRKLIRFLASQTTSQYIIATHSAHVLDVPEARVFHVVHDGRSSRVTSAVRAAEVQRVCQDLGYMASDLLQANYTVWVEGPSDRIYWRNWIGLVDPDLEEGVHYSVMSYGGYLNDGVHLLSDPDRNLNQDDLVELLRLGRSCCLIADSDKQSADEQWRPTLIRLKQESESPGSGTLLVCDWVSTVENLVPRQKFRAEVINLHRRAGPRLKTAETHGPYDEPFAGMGSSTYSKTHVARAVTQTLTKDDMDGALMLEVNTLVRAIRLANGMTVSAQKESYGRP